MYSHKLVRAMCVALTDEHTGSNELAQVGRRHRVLYVHLTANTWIKIIKVNFVKHLNSYVVYNKKPGPGPGTGPGPGPGRKVGPGPGPGPGQNLVPVHHYAA